ncbi:mediator of RNA polymerase II transcription subunit 8-A-like [Paramacrobiotus metropolitanus]|uniref:mediator of RNA polymerase II transcription subunit 8-A-like n=1 Tax=Paramacrobiotus metropolitanus TaxID=2943436 RepID=UPI002446368B|nr:mediator of RNA polymerase II transcription subunit 8-A-like [Paramacrobiotus metropolitanus]
MQRPPVPIAPSANPSATPVVPATATTGPTLNGTFLPSTSAIRPPLPPPPDPGIDMVLNHIQDIRSNISGLLLHIETQTDYLSWPSIMDRFSLISSQMANLAKTMKNEKSPDLRKAVVVPNFVTQESDANVEKLTEGRITSVNHENVPTYLRTRLDPGLEERFDLAFNKVPPGNTEIAQKADKQIQQLNKIVSSLIDHVEQNRAEETKTAGKSAMPVTYNSEDTRTIFASAFTGKGLSAISSFGGTGRTQQQGPTTGPGSKAVGQS